jgi:N-methylhydantoinase A
VRDAATGEAAEWAIHARGDLAEGVAVSGPAIITEDETSTIVGPGWRARYDGLGYIHLSRELRT